MKNLQIILLLLVLGFILPSCSGPDIPRAPGPEPGSGIAEETPLAEQREPPAAAPENAKLYGGLEFYNFTLDLPEHWSRYTDPQKPNGAWYRMYSLDCGNPAISIHAMRYWSEMPGPAELANLLFYQKDLQVLQTEAFAFDNGVTGEMTLLENNIIVFSCPEEVWSLALALRFSGDPAWWENGETQAAVLQMAKTLRLIPPREQMGYWTDIDGDGQEEQLLYMFGFLEIYKQNRLISTFHIPVSQWAEPKDQRHYWARNKDGKECFVFDMYCQVGANGEEGDIEDYLPPRTEYVLFEYQWNGISMEPTATHTEVILDYHYNPAKQGYPDFGYERLW